MSNSSFIDDLYSLPFVEEDIPEMNYIIVSYYMFPDIPMTDKINEVKKIFYKHRRRIEFERYVTDNEKDGYQIYF